MRDARSRGAGSPGAVDTAEEMHKKWITMRRCAACGKAFATLPGYVYHLSVQRRMRWYCSYTCMRTVQRPMEERRRARMLRYQAKIAGGPEGACTEAAQAEEACGDGDV